MRFECGGAFYEPASLHSLRYTVWCKWCKIITSAQ